MHAFVRDADDTIEWIQEKDVLVSSDNYGQNLESVRALQVKHEGFEVRRQKLQKTSAGCPLQGKIRENREFCERKTPCREKSGNLGKFRAFYKNMSEKYQGIFNLFHDIKNRRNDDIYVI